MTIDVNLFGLRQTRNFLSCRHPVFDPVFVVDLGSGVETFLPQLAELLLFFRIETGARKISICHNQVRSCVTRLNDPHFPAREVLQRIGRMNGEDKNATECEWTAGECKGWSKPKSAQYYSEAGSENSSHL